MIYISNKFHPPDKILREILFSSISCSIRFMDVRKKNLSEIHLYALFDIFKAVIYSSLCEPGIISSGCSF